MALTRGQRTRTVAALSLDRALRLRRLGLGAALTTAGTGLALALPGPWSLLALPLVAPGLWTASGARKAWVGACPACGARLGDGLLRLPGDPVLAPGALDHRCPSCGIYVDAESAGLREVPFSRCLEATAYTMAFDAEPWAQVRWGDRCVRCNHPGTRRLQLSDAEVGVLSSGAPRWGALDETAGPAYCDAHGDEDTPASRALVVARTPARAQCQFALYAAYRALLDDNRERADVTVRAMEEPPPTTTEE